MKSAERMPGYLNRNLEFSWFDGSETTIFVNPREVNSAAIFFALLKSRVTISSNGLV